MTHQPGAVPTIEVTEADRRRREGSPSALIVDVREPNEAVVARVEGAVLFPLSTFAARFAELGYIDDEAYARARAGGLLRRGYGARRVEQALRGAGIAEEVRAEVEPGEHARRAAALALARKRRFGPFGSPPPDRERREKQVAAMIRAGHGFDAARAVLDAASADEVERWVAEASADENEEP